MSQPNWGQPDPRSSGPTSRPYPGQGPPYGAPPYGPPGYGQPTCGQPGHGRSPAGTQIMPTQPGPAAPPLGPWGPPAMRRPASVTMAATLAVTASLQFVCVLGFLWLVAYAGMQDLPTSNLGADSATSHLLRRFHLAMLEGLAWPLFLIPLASFGLGFFVLLPRPWTRWALTLLGVGAFAWSGIWLHRQFMWWLPAALYVLVACLLLWTPAASAWYRARGRSPGLS